MRLKIIILILFFSLTILSEENYFTKLLNEKDYFRAIGEFKRIYFEKGYEKNCKYYLKISSLYALSGYDTFSFKYLDLLTEVDLSESCFVYDGVVRSYLNFKRGDFNSAIFEIEDFKTDGVDTLMLLLDFLKKNVYKESVKILDFLDDSIKNDLKGYQKVKLKSPEFSFALSSFLPGLGEFYSGYPSFALRDFLLTTFSNILFLYSFFKDPKGYKLEKFELSLDYFKNRDYFLTLFIYSSLVSRFQNGSKSNAYTLALKRNEEIRKKYLTKLYNLVEKKYQDILVDFVLSY
ncbi:MAG: hypothetical protein XD76_0213 [candidate division TA06 bacterium 32_111]|uniref:Uncharacterized protein n=2 Tax=Bacteria candidate phyla TaxID=1783234 RepID=A0A101I135_UNCT6|nr:MAG: hypothetical protein XD76_0213 [candidate division TA06 bacterium 32_111]KUK86836.1 MAG: hypothetical protein XE03_1199 [candidate division TA06 bacterium 34_109]HAF07325.1 hypothetical protein [candidate division WOR-3 bacterium]HCP16441.1 hypothetical protein [candidate division WOR-3 bacterium]